MYQIEIILRDLRGNITDNKLEDTHYPFQRFISIQKYENAIIYDLADCYVISMLKFLLIAVPKTILPLDKIF